MERPSVSIQTVRIPSPLLDSGLRHDANNYTSTMSPRLRQRLELRSESAQLGTEGSRLSNKDMDPVPLDSPQRTWGWPSLLGFWIAEAFSISMYQGKLYLGGRYVQEYMLNDQ